MGRACNPFPFKFATSSAGASTTAVSPVVAELLHHLCHECSVPNSMQIPAVRHMKQVLSCRNVFSSQLMRSPVAHTAAVLFRFNHHRCNLLLNRLRCSYVLYRKQQSATPDNGCQFCPLAATWRSRRKAANGNPSRGTLCVHARRTQPGQTRLSSSSKKAVLHASAGTQFGSLPRAEQWCRS